MVTTAPETPLSGLARHLVSRGMLDRQTAERAQIEARAASLPLISYLTQQDNITSRNLAMAFAQDFSVPIMDLDAVNIDYDVSREVGEKLIRKHRVIPFFRRGKHLFVAISDPTNLQALDEIKFHTGLMVEFVVTEEGKQAKWLAQTLETIDSSLSGLVDEDLADLETVEVDAAPMAEEESDQEDEPIIKFVNKILMDAIHKGASDIHFEPYEKFFRVRIRLDGMLQEVARPPVTLTSKIAARLKVMARLDIAERRKPQDGRIKLRLSRNRAIDFRVSSIPTAYGEKIVLRLLDPGQAQLGVDALGYEENQRQIFLEALKRPHGMILVTGPTGSGKTVSLYTAVNILNTIERNISTAEDPVEIQLPGINQVSVNPRIGLTFANALRAFLRQDPDVILVGEIRDLETAEIAIKAAQTGHLVLSTLHTNDAPKSLTRLRDLGLPPYSIASSVNLIIAQRLVRKLCQRCRKPLEIPSEALAREGFTDAEIESGIKIFGPQGCAHCNDGYRGRTGIFEVMPVTEQMEQAIMRETSDQEIASLAREIGVWDMRRSGLEKVKNGITTLEEINRVTTD